LRLEEKEASPTPRETGSPPRGYNPAVLVLPHGRNEVCPTMRTRPGKFWLAIAWLAAALASSAQPRYSAAQQPPARTSPAPAPAKATPTRPARIEMEVSLEPGLSPTASHDWHKILTDLKVDGVRLRGALPTDKPEITTTGTATAPTYKVMGRLSGSSVLTVPGGRFQTNDRAALGAWLTKLREEGPARAAGGPRLPFGLTKDQFAQVSHDLTQQVRFSTLGKTPTEVIDKVAESLAIPLTADRAQAALLKGAPPVDVELQGMSAGTVAAYVLNNAGLALAPRANRGQPLGYTIINAETKDQRWPIGLPPVRPKTELAPKMFETVPVELDEVEISTLLASISERTNLPVLTDHRSLAKANIDLDKTVVSLPKKNLVYASVLDRTLGPKFLEYEIRVDDAGKPFLFIRAVRAGEAIEPRAGKSRLNSKGPAP
jgi:hypothetical protein